MNDHTRLIHSGKDRDPYTGASSIPIYQLSTYAQADPEHLGPYDYGRSDNPTREALEHTMAELEGGARGLAFASGMAATSSVLLLFQPGDHLLVGRISTAEPIASSPPYSGSGNSTSPLSIRPIPSASGARSSRPPAPCSSRRPPIPC